MSLNTVTIQGRLGKDVEVRYTQGENPTAIANVSVAVTRNYKDSNGNYPTDWINVTAFKNTAEFMNKYFQKGSEILINGRLQVDTWQDQQGNNRSAVKVLAENVYFCGSKNDGTNQGTHAATTGTGDFMSIPDGFEEELPFN